MSLYIPEILSEKPEERSGHICVHFRDNVFVWGGFNNENHDAEVDFYANEYLSSDSLWIYSISTCIWKHVLCNGDIPSDLSGACAACVGQTLYLFGGHCQLYGHCNYLYSLNLVTYNWKNLSESVSGQAPIPRDKFGCWVVENRIIYFGGYGPSLGHHICEEFVMHESMRGWNGQIVVLQINSDDSHEWQYPCIKGNAPRARAAHGMAKLQNKAYLFGGRHSICRDNDLHCFDLGNYEWSGRLHITGPEPCGRSWHIFIACGDNHILLHGGFDAMNHELEDAWVLDVRYLTWIQIDAFVRMSPPRTRLWHSACQTGNEGEVAIFGGCSGSLFSSLELTEHKNDLVFFHFSPQKLQRICEEAVVKSKRTLPPTLLSTLPRPIFRILAARLNISQVNANG